MGDWRWGGAVAVLRDRVVVATRPGLTSNGLAWTFDRNAGWARAPMASRLNEVAGLLLSVAQVEHIHRVGNPDVMTSLAELHLQLQ